MSTNKTLSVITAGILSVSMCGTLVSMDTFKSSEVEAVSTQTAIDIVNDMGMGWNLGNTYDCCNIDWLTPSKPSDIVTAWGNIMPTKEMISTIHDYGFESVRIPVTWYQMTDSNYDINDDYLASVKQVVDWCQEEGMYAIINMHWDDSNANSGGKNWLGTADSDFTNVQTKYTTMWNEISTYFADYDNKLVFESNNEPSISTANLMTLNQDFVDTVRSTGGNNDDRLLLISAPEANLDKACNTSSFKMPNDPANMQAVSIHYYYPTTFCVADKNSTWGYETEWGDSSDLTTLANNFDKMVSAYVDNGIPVILGEYGVLTNDAKDDTSIKTFLKTVAGTALATDGISAFLWDSGNGGDMQYFDRKELTFFDSEIGQIYIDLADSGYVPEELTWVETDITTDDKGIVAVQTGGATKVKLEATGLAGSSGTGAIGYWDNNANDGKGAWVQDTIYIRFDVDADGNATISQTADDPTTTDKDNLNNNYEVVLHDGYFEIPASASTESIQVMYFYGGYMKDDTWTTLTSDQYPTLTKAYIPGVADPDTTTTTTETIVTEPTATEPTVTETTVTTPPNEEDILGYVYPLFDNGVVSQWKNDGTLADAVPVTGNGNYTLTINIPEDGASESILFFSLGTTLNSFEQNADEEEIYKDMTFTINSITIDGVEIEYSASDNALSLDDDGASFRMSIYDEWSKRDVQDIDPNVVQTGSVVVNFTIDGVLGGGEVSSQETTVTTVDPTETTTTTITSDSSEQTTTSGGSQDVVIGDINGDGNVKSNDLLLLKKYLLGLVAEEDINAANADITQDGNIKSNDLLLLKKALLGLVEL